MPDLSDKTLDLLAEYIYLACALKEDSPPQDYARATIMSFRLGMELPLDLWRYVIHTLTTPGHTPWHIVAKVRSYQNLGDDFVDTDCIQHALGLDMPREIGRANV